ncbi:LysR family transcriptional regulator [Gammaproteobacteria bacterium 42_54_T18]|nr:LysR family transcriptional regulator [Gammaproteobacteria bacterium 42_54_T18]
MSPLNYNHLYYFYVVAKEGSIVKASGTLNLTPQTISGQISNFEDQIGILLFDRKGRKLHLSEFGQLILSYAEEIFQIGDELKNVITTQQPNQYLTFTVGITDVIPKTLAYQLLKPALDMDDPIRLICNEGDQESLLAELAVNKLDLILTDQPLQPGNNVKAYNHQLAESGLTFFASSSLTEKIKKDFPLCLSEKPFLMQSKKSVIHQRLSSWFHTHNIAPIIVAEFDDSALMKSFGQSGYGIFAGPTLIEKHIVSQYNVTVIGRTDELKEQYYAISPERRLKHPAIIEIVNAITD